MLYLRYYQIIGVILFVITLATSKGGEQKSRVVASIPISLKEQLEEYVKANPGQTEQALVIRGLHSLGFTVSDTWLIDGRKLR